MTGRMSRVRDLNVDLAAHFGFAWDPFGPIVAPEAEFCRLGLHDSLLGIVKRTVMARDMIAFTAQPASGKTVTVSWLLEQLMQTDNLHVIEVNPVDGQKVKKVTLKRLLHYELTGKDTLSVTDSRLRGELLKATRQQLVCLFIDNAHAIPAETLVALKVMNEWGTGMRQRLFSVVLAGYPPLQARIERTEELRSRFNIYQMANPTPDDIRPYIKRRLEAVGGLLSVFSDEALEWLEEQQRSTKEPVRFGELNMSLQAGLYQAAVMGEPVVSLGIMQEADLRYVSTADLYELAQRPDRTALAHSAGLTPKEVWQVLQSEMDVPWDWSRKVRDVLRKEIGRAA